MFNPATELNKFIDDTKKGEPVKMVSFEPSPYGTTFKISEQKTSSDDAFLLKLTIKCWESINVSEEDYLLFGQIIASPEGRKSWLYYLNERRIKAQFKISPSGFATLSKIMHDFLDCVHKENDEYSAKMSIILSQTFYYEKASERVYLHTSLISHQIWNDPAIWTKMIEDGIQKEMANYAQFCMDETTEEHKERMAAIMMSQLSSYIHIMKTFQIRQEFIQSVITSLVEKYKLSDVPFSDLIGS